MLITSETKLRIWGYTKTLIPTLVKNRYKVLLTLVLLAIAAYICFYQLGSGFFENWDEAWYAEVTKQMLNNHNPIVLYWNGKVFLDKTPLNFWFNALSSLIFGLNEFSIRLTSAISGFIIITIVTMHAMRKWGMVPAIAAFSALALNNLFIWRTRTGNLDALASLLVLLIYFVMISKHRWRLVMLGILFGLTYLQKASLVGYPLAIFFLHELVFQWRHILKNFIGYIVCGAIFISIVGIWLYLGNLQIGSEFANYYLYKADQGVARVALQYFNTDYLWHAYYSLQRRIFYLFAIGIVFLGINARKREYLILAAFALALFIQLSFTQRDNNWYLVPSIPFWGLTVGFGTWSIIHLTRKFLKRKMYIIIFQIFILIPILYVSYKTLTVNIRAIIETHANVGEVASARMIRKLSRPSDKILRLDFSYPVTIYYADRITEYHTTIDGGLTASIENNRISWVVGKNDQVRKFLELYPLTPKNIFTSGDEETIVEL
jgi:4-amino-4-deoxy-L-arabinose transferase-like glycosyltransferase